jgi:hypothetical protein
VTGSPHPHERILGAVESAESLTDAASQQTADRGRVIDISSGTKGKKTTAREKLLTIFSDIELFRDESGEVYGSVRANGHRETFPLRSRYIRRAMAGLYYEKTGTTIGSSGIDDVLNVLEYAADRYSNQNGRPNVYPVFRRVGTFGGEMIFHDLCDESWRSVQIGREGWKIVSDHHSFVKFLRSPDSRALPEPEGGSLIEELRGFLNLRTDDDFMLAVAFILMCFRCDEPCPPLLVSGEQGSGKSNLSRIIRALIDPNVSPIRRPPRDDEHLAAAVANNYVLPFDNVSSIPQWLSDGVAAAVTGAGFARRALYSDNEERTITARPRMILNGIPDFTSNADLADRSIFLNLPAIKAADRVPERTYWERFEAARPRIMGAIYDAVSIGLSRIGTMSLDEFPRMADFCGWIEACAPGLGWKQGHFTEVLNANRKGLVELGIEADPVAMAVRDFMTDRHAPWEGTATELLEALTARVASSVQKSRRWPTSAHAMGSQVRRAAPALRDHHRIEVASKHSGSRLLRIYFLDQPAQ